MPKTYAPWTDEDWDIIMQLSPADLAERVRSIEVITMIRDDRADADVMAACLYARGYVPRAARHNYWATVGLGVEDAHAIVMDHPVVW